MIRESRTRIVVEDAIMGGESGCVKSEHSFGSGYDNFNFPLTVSFYEHGAYKVVIEGKKAVVEKLNIY